MRPQKLTMVAFGPYAAQETIDFTVLGNTTMFVISGKTGSGKTTIFDGISFAVYGKASGEDRNGAELRSQFAEEDLLTSVSLEFQLRGKQYFIKRSPQQEKKKERGDGFRMISATAELYQLNEEHEWKMIAANVRDVDEKIKEIMIIDSNQFRQILMIPQGEFRKLLTSDSKDKELILQRLFHTEVYKRIEEKLREQASYLKKEIEGKEEERNLLTGKITAVYNEQLKNELMNEFTNDTVILSLLKDEIQCMTDQLVQYSKAMKEKEQEKEQASKELFDGEHIVNRMKQRDELEKRKSQLLNQQEEFKKKEENIQSANKAALISKQEELCQRLSRDKKSIQLEHETIKNTLVGTSTQLQISETNWKDEQNREDERIEAQNQLNQLNAIKEDVYSFALLKQEVGKLEENLKARQIDVKQSKLSLQKLRVVMLETKTKREKLQQTELHLLKNKKERENIEEALSLLSKYEEQLKKSSEQQRIVEKKKELLARIQLQYTDATNLFKELEKKWLNGQAATLSKNLVEGESCPVCGSLHHPNPFSQQEEYVLEKEDLESAKSDAERLQQERYSIETNYVEEQSRHTFILENLNTLQQEIVKIHPHFEEKQTDVLRMEYVEQSHLLSKRNRELENDKLQLLKLEKEMTTLEESEHKFIERFDSLTEQQNELRIQYTERNTKYEGMKDRIPVELRTVNAFDGIWNEAQQNVKRLTEAYEKAQAQFLQIEKQYTSQLAGFQAIDKQLQAKEEELNNEKEIFLRILKEQGFINYKEYEGAKKTQFEIQQLEKEIREYHSEVRSVTDRYLELVETLKTIEKPNLAKLHEKVEVLKEEFDELNRKHTNLYVQKRNNDEIEQNLLMIQEEIKGSEDRYKLVGELSDISRGQNHLKVTFERYVLASFLDDILHCANDRLRKMTSGRYEMIRKSDRSKGNVQSGLELLVFDQYTGQERHVKTLSGGESFKAALSLALGLADVVQNYAGGVSLETMFIDEGFGTLDPESLDQAIEALIDIQSSGRLVGIISHVPELKERIEARLEVTSTQTGSTTEFHFLN